MLSPFGLSLGQQRNIQPASGGEWAPADATMDPKTKKINRNIFGDDNTWPKNVPLWNERLHFLGA